MLLKTLEYLEAIYKYKSFTKAADALFVSQPAISIAINTLEKELGVELMVRNPKNVKFTTIGEIFIARVNKILNEIRQIELEMKDYSSDTKRVLRIGITSTSSISCVHEYLYKYFLPNLAENEIVYVDENSAYNHIDKIKEGILDICFNGIPNDIDCASFEVIPLMTVEACLIVNVNHKFAKYKVIPLEMIDGADFATMPEDSLMFKYFNNQCKEEGIFYHEISRHTSMTSYLKMVSTGVCAGIVAIDKSKNHLADDLYKNDSIAVLPFENPIHINLGFIYKKNSYLNQLARRFIEAIKQNIDQ